MNAKVKQKREKKGIKGGNDNRGADGTVFRVSGERGFDQQAIGYKNTEQGRGVSIGMNCPEQQHTDRNGDQKDRKRCFFQVLNPFECKNHRFDHNGQIEEKRSIPNII